MDNELGFFGLEDGPNYEDEDEEDEIEDEKSGTATPEQPSSLLLVVGALLDVRHHSASGGEWFWLQLGGSTPPYPPPFSFSLHRNSFS